MTRHRHPRSPAGISLNPHFPFGYPKYAQYHPGHNGVQSEREREVVTLCPILDHGNPQAWAGSAFGRSVSVLGTKQAELTSAMDRLAHRYSKCPSGNSVRGWKGV